MPIAFINSFSIVPRFKSITRMVQHLLQEEIRVAMEIVAMVGVLPANVVLNMVGVERPLLIVTNQHLLQEEIRVAMEILAMVGALPANAVLNTAGAERPLPTVSTQHLSLLMEEEEEETHVAMESAAMVGALPVNAVLSGDGVVGLWITVTKMI